MNINEIFLFERQQAAKVELSLVALNQVSELDKTLRDAQHKARHPHQAVEASRKRKRMKILAKRIVEAI